MDEMLTGGSIGGGSLAGRASETIAARSLGDSSCPSLSVRARAAGFVVCMVFGLLLMFVSSYSLTLGVSVTHFLLPYFISMALLFGG